MKKYFEPSIQVIILCENVISTSGEQPALKEDIGTWKPVWDNLGNI